MKIIAALLLTATAAFAGPTENITGCATVPVDGANYTVRADVTCALPTGNTGASDIVLEVLRSLEK